jgi:N-acetylglutamate synthase/N-acetylornithine aminotransferase
MLSVIFDIKSYHKQHNSYAVQILSTDHYKKVTILLMFHDCSQMLSLTNPKIFRCLLETIRHLALIVVSDGEGTHKLANIDDGKRLSIFVNKKGLVSAP